QERFLVNEGHAIGSNSFNNSKRPLTSSGVRRDNDISPPKGLKVFVAAVRVHLHEWKSLWISLHVVVTAWVSQKQTKITTPLPQKREMAHERPESSVSLRSTWKDDSFNSTRWACCLCFENGTSVDAWLQRHEL